MSICECGLTRTEVVEKVGEDRMEEFDRWMRGQTVAVCDGRRYNHDTEEYEVSCAGEKHGIAYYPWDVEQFLSGGGPFD